MPPATRSAVAPVRSAGLTRAGLATALTGALALTLGGLWWLVAPARSPFGAANPTGMDLPMLAEVVGRPVSQTGTLVLALVVTALAAAALRGRVRTPVVAGAAVLAMVWLTSASGLSTVGYLMAVAVPAALVVLAVTWLRSRPRALWVAIPGAAALAGVLAVTGGGDVLAELTGKLGATLVPVLDGPVLLGVSVLAVQTGLLLALVGCSAEAASGASAASASGTSAEAASGAPAGGRPGAFAGWLLRRRRLVTLLAAGALLPYLVTRLTWLTPLTLAAPGPLEPADRLWGLSLGAASAAGIVLTLGLILPWGERFPHWFPGVGGRPVPIALAVVPGGLVATVVTLSAVPLFVQILENSGLGTAVMVALLIPAWFWGPMLGLALWAYVLHRMAGPVPAGTVQSAQPAPGNT